MSLKDQGFLYHSSARANGGQTIISKKKRKKKELTETGITGSGPYVRARRTSSSSVNIMISISVTPHSFHCLACHIYVRVWLSWCGLCSSASSSVVLLWFNQCVLPRKRLLSVRMGSKIFLYWDSEYMHYGSSPSLRNSYPVAVRLST